MTNSCKNNRQIPSDTLWKPSIHDCAPVIRPNFKRKAKPSSKDRKKLRRTRGNLVRKARKLSGIKGLPPCKTIAMVARCLDTPIPARFDIETQIAILREYITSRGGYIAPPKDTFYRSRDWRELRYQVLVKSEGRCMACNRSDQPLHVDHIKPRSKFPTLELDPANLQVLCEDCNLGKSNKDQTDWRQS